ncbi:MAG: hypothetical protein NTZ17_11020 [Phycisphaerae bacterium]|nr:hypothetical protein [Phycisphaerae bacterium]
MLVLFIVLAAIIAVGGTLILRSDWLGNQVVARVSGQLGVDVSVRSFSLGWGGDATLGNVSVRMPLSDEVVFSADRMKLGLNAVPLLVLGRPIGLHSVEINHPTVFLHQSQSGHWNVQDVWMRVQASIGPSSPQGRGIELPDVVIHDGTVRIVEPNAAPQTVSPIEFTGRRQGQILWAFDLQAAPIASLAGQVATGGDWASDVRFRVQDLGPLVRSLLGQDLAPVQAAGRWKGALAQDTWNGTIQLDESTVGRVTLQGDAQVEATSDRVTISPRRLTVSEPNLAGEAIQLTDGAVGISPERITLESLAAKAGALGGRIDGHWNPDARNGEFSGSWVAAMPGPSFPSHGTYRFSVKSPQEGRKEAQANVTVQARTPLGSWHAVADVQASGVDWPTSRWQIQVPTFSWSRGERQVDVTGAAARIDLRWPQVQLASLSIPQAKQASANARFDMHTRQWSAQIAVDQLRWPSLGANGLDFRLQAEGDGNEARVSELRVTQNESVVTAQGDLSFVGGGPQNVHLSADWPARSLHPEPPAAAQPPETVPAAQPAGRWRLEAVVTGQVQPLALDAEATLSGQNIALGKRSVDRVQVPVHVTADDKQVDATTQPFDLLGGRWQLTGRYDVAKWATEVHVFASDLSQAALASMAGLPLASGGQAHGEIRLRMPGFEIQKAVAVGTWSAQDVNIPPLKAQRAQGTIRIGDGAVRLDDIQLEQDGGRAQASMSLQLDQPQIVSVELDAKSWSARLPGRPVTLVMDGRTKLRVNVAKKTADGDAHLTGKVVWQDRDLADVRLTTRVQGQTVEVQEFHARTLGGSADGAARIPLNHWIDSAAQLRWQGIGPKQLEAWLPPFARYQGAMSGSLVVEQTAGAKRRKEGEKIGTSEGKDLPPSDLLPLSPSRVPTIAPGEGPPPLGPMRFVLDANMAGDRFGPAQIDICQITGYVDQTRLLIDNACFDVLGGRLKARARLSQHTDKYYGSIATDFNNLNLDQLVHAIDPNASEHVGRLSGSATILPAFQNQVLLAGEARINLTESDLVNNGVTQTLYNTLSLHFGSQKPTGTGEIRLSFQGPAVAISSAQYFNRGVEIRGAGAIKDINLGGDSPIEGYAVASTRILKGAKLPGIGSLDRVMDLFQTGAASVKIAGVLDNAQVKVVPLPEILSPFRRLLWAQLKEQKSVKE